MNKFAVMMHLPEGKIPGFYAQIVKALANKTQLFDRDKELLIVDSMAETHLVKEILEHFNITYEDFLLTLLPENKKLFSMADDFGFNSRSGLFYLYSHLVSFFHFKASLAAVSDQPQAYEQMAEYVIAAFEYQELTLYAVDRQFEELIHGIAKAYHCEVEFRKM